MIVRLIDHWDLHWRLWGSFEKVVKHCRVVGATVMLQWPRFCDYWQQKKVSEFLAEMKSSSQISMGACMDLFAFTKVMSHCPLESHGGLHISIHLLSLISTICAMVLTDMCHAVDRMQYTLRDTLPSFAKRCMEIIRGQQREEER